MDTLLGRHNPASSTSHCATRTLSEWQCHFLRPAPPPGGSSGEGAPEAGQLGLRRAFISGLPDQDLVGGHGLGHTRPAAVRRLPLPSPHLHQPHHLQVRWPWQQACLGCLGAQGFSCARGSRLRSPSGPASVQPRCALTPPVPCTSSGGWVLEAKRRLGVPFPRALRAPVLAVRRAHWEQARMTCRSRTAWARRGASCAAGAGGRAQGSGACGPETGLLGAEVGPRGAPGHPPHHWHGLPRGTGWRSWPRHPGLRAAEGRMPPSCSHAGGSSGAHL